MLLKHVGAASGFPFRVGTVLHQIYERGMLNEFRNILQLLRTNQEFRSFHEHESDQLPAFYNERYEGLLGRYADLISAEDRKPVLLPSRTTRPSPAPLPLT